MKLSQLLGIVGLLAEAVTAVPSYNPRAFDAALKARQSTEDPLTVDLGYEIYKGINNASQGLNKFLGYACLLNPGLKLNNFIAFDMLLHQRESCAGNRQCHQA